MPHLPSAVPLLILGMCCAQRGLSREVDSPIGRHVESFTLNDYRGKEHSLSDFAEYKLLVVAFLGTECPLVKRYGPRLAEMAAGLEPKGVGFVGINANSQDSLTEIAAYARRHGIGFPILKDLQNHVADQMGAMRTPEVFLLDQDRVIRYWGRIDDQFGVGYTRDAPQRDDLALAIEELLAGSPVSVPVTDTAGCHIGRVRAPRAASDVTYSNQIARILQNRCVECHRDGEIAPFALTDYSEVAGWAEMIAEVVKERRMPPWHANPKYGRFENDRHLSEKEQAMIYAWVQAGAPEGDPSDLPEETTRVTGWQLPRVPDFVAPITETPYRVPAEGAVRYQYFQVDPGFQEDKWVTAVEIQPGNRAVVHHVLMFAGSPIDIRDRFGGGAHGYDGIFVPGQRVRPYPDGMAKRIPAGSTLVFQVHYTPIGTEQFDQSRVGMNFVDPAAVQYEVRTTSAVNADLRIPPHEKEYRVEAASAQLPDQAQLLALTPHMHLRGKSFFYEAVFPDGHRRTLLDVPNYDFNWQTAYRLTEPQRLPRGSRIHCVAQFDNSAANLNNPDPTKTVRWGQQTWDEMMIGYFDYAVPVDAGEEPSPIDHRNRRMQELFDRLDKNIDGSVSKDEVPYRFRYLFDRLDRDKNEALDLEELSILLPLAQPGQR